VTEDFIEAAKEISEQDLMEVFDNLFYSKEVLDPSEFH
jgi:hypothetical protein